MTRDEFKSKILQFGNNLIDMYFPEDSNIASRMVNASVKYILKNKISDLDKIINLFADSNGNIDIMDFISYMKQNLISDGIKINIRDYINTNSPLAAMLPDKTLVIKQEDLDSFLQINK